MSIAIFVIFGVFFSSESSQKKTCEVTKVAVACFIF
jgi:hypothetical protein